MIEETTTNANTTTNNEVASSEAVQKSVPAPLVKLLCKARNQPRACLLEILCAVRLCRNIYVAQVLGQYCTGANRNDLTRKSHSAKARKSDFLFHAHFCQVGFSCTRSWKHPLPCSSAACVWTNTLCQICHLSKPHQRRNKLLCTKHLEDCAYRRALALCK